MDMLEMGKCTKAASAVIASLSDRERSGIIEKCADALLESRDKILAANKTDMDNAEKKGISGAFADRLMLNEKRIGDMAKGLYDVAALHNPVGEIISMNTVASGLKVGKKRVPLGVVGIIFESRPNVAADVFGLCFKTGNAVILRGGSEAVNSVTAITNIFREVLKKSGLPENAVIVVEDTRREVAAQMMKLNGYIDVLIPRGGKGLIKAVVENSTIPTIETGTGNCHIFVDETADLENAVDIIINAKIQKPSACNACESLLVHEKIAGKFIPKIVSALEKVNVEVRGDESFCKEEGVLSASEEDYYEEFLALILSAKVVKGVDEAIEHIRKYGTGHSEAILTESYKNAEKFLDEVDSAAVYVNASTRFTDGGEFGLGAELGISTQKLHARGPMGLEALTTTKYIIYGNGQTRK